jgi:membrane-associated phospholipid phosphatase
MQKALSILAQICSIILHPLLMPTYGIILFFMDAIKVYENIPTSFQFAAIAGTALITLVIPAVIIFTLWKTKRIDSLHIDKAEQRTKPYAYTIVAYIFWMYFIMVILQLPMLIITISICAIMTLLAVIVINRIWKISAHLTGIGGLLGGICTYALYAENIPYSLMFWVLMLALVLMYARLYLNAHSPLQVVGGFLLGLFCVFLPNLLLIYA